jgi:hypothetical protein
MPLAIMLVNGGPDGDYKEYYHTISNGLFLFGWYQPDDSLVDSSGQLPVMLSLPHTNGLEHLAGMYRTGLAEFRPQNYGWRQLQAVDRLVHHFASKLDLYGQDMDDLMLRSRALKDSGQPMAGNLTEVSRKVACEWVRRSRDRWRLWIPALCPPGSLADVTLTDCLPCPAGMLCFGGPDPGRPCPVGVYCPENATEAVVCPAGRSTAGPGASALRDCNQCLDGLMPVAGSGCIPISALVPAVLGAALLLLLGATTLAVLRRRAAARAENEGSEVQRRKRVAQELRVLLRITPADGFLLHNERPPGRARANPRRPLVTVQTSCLDAAGEADGFGRGAGNVSLV